MDGTFGGGDLISASLAIMLGGGDDAELHDKEVSLSTSQITGSQTAVFEYDPQNEPATGTPPGPWDGYSLFTIDLSGVKDDIEAMLQCKAAVVSAIQQYVPDYVLPASGCPDDGIDDVYDAGYDEGYDDGYDAGEASVALDTKTILHNGIYAASAESPPLDGFSEVTVSVPLGAKFITANGTYLPASDNLDGYNSVVVDVQSCGCYTFPPDVGFEQVIPVIGTDLLYPEGNTYHFRYYIQDRTYGEPYVDRNIMTKILGPQTGEPYKDIRLLFEIYDNSGTMVSQQIIGNSQDYYIYENDDYFMVTSTSMSYGSTKAFNYTFEYTYHNYYGQQTVTESGSVDLSDYIDTTTQNPSYTVKSNS